VACAPWALTLEEIRDLAATYLQQTDEPSGPRLAAMLRAVRARTEQHIAELQQRLKRIEQFEAAHQDELAGLADFRAQDPRAQTGRA
jgi:MerR family copper efflux transcriptional regulator